MQEPSLQELTNMPNSSLSPGVSQLKATFPFCTLRVFKAVEKPHSEAGTWCKASPAARFLHCLAGTSLFSAHRHWGRGSAAMTVPIQGEAFRKDSVACET